MKSNRKLGLSLLDYLWVNFGEYFVSKTFEELSIPTSDSVKKIAEDLQSGAINSLKVVGNQLIGSSIDGKDISVIDISDLVTRGKTITNFGKRYTTEEDTGVSYELGTPVYFLSFSDGTLLLVKIDEYTGAITNSIVLHISDYLITADLKINNKDSVVQLSETEDGINADLKISNEDSSVTLSKELEGLKAKIILDNEGKVLKFKLLTLRDYLDLANPDLTTVYFIEGKQYFYFGKYLIGEGTTNLDDYYTKDYIDEMLASKQYVKDELASVGMDWNSI